MDDAYMRALRTARENGVSALDEPTGKRILDSVGIRVPRSTVANLGVDVGRAAASLHAPYVLKLVATGVVHKSDVGGVRLNLHSPEEVAAAADDLLLALRAKGIQPEAWLIEEMAPRGVEVVVGGTMDPEFGPMVMVGIGGIFVEVLKDVAFRICPIDQVDAREMLDELKGSALLRGARGSDPVNVDAIIDVLLRVGGEGGLLLRGAADLSELDINPLIVSRDAAVAVDARFILRNPS
jgi:acetate---CoA ligase (ADP-forming) subunit beta